jgi:hypothetical protein
MIDMRVDGKIPGRGADADRALAGDLLERVGGTKVSSRSTPGGSLRVRLVDPGMDADLVALIGDRAHFLGMQQGAETAG